MAFYYPTRNRDQLARTAAGVISENGAPYIFSAASAPVSQTVYGMLLGLRAGDVVTGVLLRNNVAAAGTDPTVARAAIANSAGVILALSGDVKAAASWPLGACPFALSAPYTVLSDGGYFACFVVNGTWGSTQPTPFRAGGSSGSSSPFGSNVGPGFSWTAQADLPAVSSSLTITAGSTLGYYMGFY